MGRNLLPNDPSNGSERLKMAIGLRMQFNPAEYKEIYDCYIRNQESVRATATELGFSRGKVRKAVSWCHDNGLAKADMLSIPDFPADKLPIEKVIEARRAQSQMRRSSYAAHTWFPVTVKDTKPIGVLWFGDPHVDDDGCDWNVLEKHVVLCKETPGLYGANIGDTTNNWIGRLISKYASQEASLHTARRLAEWFMLDSGVTWLIWLLGNHDQWGDGSAILAEIAKRHGTQKVVMHDWEARFQLQFPNGEPIKVWAAHDFPGDSMWNPLHGPVKAARFGLDIDLLVCGHKHNWGISHWELGEKGTTPLMIRTRGYKFNDDYARRIGKIEQEEGAGILTIFNPMSSTRAGRVQAFADVELGADFLKWLRSRA